MSSPWDKCKHDTREATGRSSQHGKLLMVQAVLQLRHERHCHIACWLTNMAEKAELVTLQRPQPSVADISWQAESADMYLVGSHSGQRRQYAGIAREVRLGVGDRLWCVPIKPMPSTATLLDSAVLWSACVASVRWERLCMHFCLHHQSRLWHDFEHA